MGRVKTLLNEHVNEGMKYWRKVKREFDQR